MTNDTIILSDLHGCFFTMVRLLNRAPKGVKVVLAGDLIDRGPHSRKVVEFAMQNGIPTCSANHEDLCLAYSAHAKRGYKARCTRDYKRDIWLYNGGEEAMANWQPDESRWREGLPKDVLDWMQALPPYIVSDTLDEKGRKGLFSHTGYGLNADTGHWFSALWGRHPYDGDFPADGYYRVFGHTRKREVPQTEDYSMIDTGAAYEGYGILTAFLWPTKTLLQQPYDETPCEPAFQIIDGRLADLA